MIAQGQDDREAILTVLVRREYTYREISTVLQHLIYLSHRLYNGFMAPFFVQIRPNSVSTKQSVYSGEFNDHIKWIYVHRLECSGRRGDNSPAQYPADRHAQSSRE